MPPLRERKDEILAFARLFLDKHAMPGTHVPEITPALVSALLAYHWPGNIRELENVIRRLLVFGDADLIAQDLLKRVSRPVLDRCLAVDADGSQQGQRAVSTLGQVSQARDQEEAQVILNALMARRWNRKSAARLLNIDYKACWPFGRFSMRSSSARYSRSSRSDPLVPLSNRSQPNNCWRTSDTVRFITRCSADARMKNFDVSSSCVRSAILVFGADVTSSLKPLPTCNNWGRLCIENRNAVFVPRAVWRICAKFLYPNGSELVQDDTQNRPVRRLRSSSLSYRLPTTN